MSYFIVVALTRKKIDSGKAVTSYIEIQFPITCPAKGVDKNLYVSVYRVLYFYAVPLRGLFIQVVNYQLLVVIT